MTDQFPFRPEQKGCVCTGCTKPGAFMPVIRIWAKGFPKEGHDPLEFRMLISVCGDHRNTDVQDFVGLPQQRNMIEVLCASQGKAAPDLDSAELSWAAVTQ